jgi:glycosyltransferase involved in cell wall biosynthesis
MTGLLEALFWLTSTLTVLPYLIYPILLYAGVKIRGRSGEVSEPAEWPTVTVVVSAHNEDAVIENKIRTTLALDYPRDRISVVIVSDASSDATNEIVSRLAEEDGRVHLVELSEHRGKTAGLNVAMETITTDVVVFTDANAIFAPDALREISRELCGDNIGYVVGSALYSDEPGSTAGGNEGLYWKFELAIKQLESAFESVIGGDGAIYGIWRRLYEPLAAEDINDFMNPIQIIGAGYRGVFSASARAFEDAANDFGKEFRRKRRIVCRTWGALLRYGIRRLYRANPRYTCMLFAHKVVRWFTLLWIALALGANIALLGFDGPAIYVLTLGMILLSIGLAIAGWVHSLRDPRVPAYFGIPYYFYLSNLAALLGIIDYARGNRYVTWQHVRT